jgi:hypothetical protein
MLTGIAVPLVFRNRRQKWSPGAPADGAQFPCLEGGHEPENLVDTPSHGQVLYHVRADEPVRSDEERPPQCGPEPLQKDPVFPRDLLGEISKERVCQLPQFLVDPRKVGKLAVRADAEDLRACRSEFALPPGELEDLRMSYGGEVQRVEKQDDPLPLVVGQPDLPELPPHDP